MSTQKLKSLNHYPEFRTDAGIDAIIEYITDAEFPPALTTRQRTRYEQKYGAASGFVVRNNRLFYNPNENFDLEVIKPSNRRNKILEIYGDIQRGFATGLSAFYHQIAMSYLNIPKDITDDFLKQQGNYTVSRTPHKLINQPIITNTPNERWGADLIDMQAYYAPRFNRNKYILTVVDYFSGKVWARAILSRNNNARQPVLSNAMQEICTEANTYPRIIQVDSEFKMGAFSVWCRSKRIELIRTTSYTPNSNGRVERMNREIRKKIRAGFIMTNSFAWEDRLQDYVKNINNQQSSRNRLTPNILWTQGYRRPNAPTPPTQNLRDDMTAVDKLQYNQAFIDNRARKQVALGRPPPVLQVGDLVRIKLLALSNEQRKAWEASIGCNKIVIHYTPQVFRIKEAIRKPANYIRRDEYTLENLDGDTVYSTASRALPKKFFGNDLIKVPDNYVQTNVDPRTLYRAMEINKLV